MRLENLRLPALVLAQLYKQPLIEDQSAAVQPVAAEAEPEPVPIPTKKTKKAEEATGYKILGKNGRRITMLVHFPAEVFIPDRHLQFLTKMLEACKMNLGDVAIVNTATTTVDMEQLKAQLQPQQVFLFGVDPVSVKLPFSFPFFKEQEHGGCIFLYTPPLNELNQDTDEGKLLKSKLWVCLKKLFGV